MRIRMLDSHAGLDFSYAAGQVVDAPRHIAKDLLRGGVAVEVGEDEGGRETATAVADEHAVASVAPVKKAGKKKKAAAAGR